MAKKVVKIKAKTSSVGKCSNLFKKSANGFTLIEVLVIIVIIGSLAGLAVFSIGNKPQQDRLERESMRLQSSLRWVLDEALFQNSEWGIRVEENRYSFYQFNLKKKQWTKVDDIEGADKTELKGLFEHKLPDGYWIEAEVEGTPLKLAANEPDTDSPGLSSSSPGLSTPNDEQKDTPTILLLSSGEYTPFVIDLGFKSDRKTLFRIKGDGVADIQLISGNDIEKQSRP
jgi:general secretion pathway protein H